MAKKNRYRWGKLDFSQPFPKAYKFMLIAGVACLIGCFALSAGEVLSGDPMSESMSMIVGFMGIYGIAAPFSVLVNYCIWRAGHAAYLRNARKEEAKKEEKRRFAQEHPHYEQEQFYLLCKAQGITSIDTPAAVARMVLLAKNNQVPGSEKDLIDAFKLGQKDIAGREQKQKLAAQEKEEAQLDRENLRYKDARSQQKRILMCREKAQQYRNEEASYRAQSRATQDAIFRGTQSAMQKETDWATHGGIASGIAGPAAGLAVAADIQRKNADIREQNAALRQLSARAAIEASRGTDSLAYDASKNAEKWEERAAAAENKLVQTLPEAQLMGLLSPEGSARSSKTGAITVNVRISPTKDLKIYETVSAVVDGILKVQILDETGVVGIAYVPLPWNGSESGTILKGICRNPVRQAKKYTVKVEPHSLWAMER